MQNLIFTDGKTGAPYFIALTLMIAVALLLWVAPRSGPSKWVRGLISVVIVVMTGLVVSVIGQSRSVEIDLATKQVIERKSFLGVKSANHSALTDYSAVVVERRDVTNTKGHSDSRKPDSQRPKETRTYYDVSLAGPTRKLRLASKESDLLEAEEEALRIAKATGLPAKRRGYEVEIKRGAEAMAAASAPTSRPAGVSEDLWKQMQEARAKNPLPPVDETMGNVPLEKRTWVRIIENKNAESLIEPP